MMTNNNRAANKTAFTVSIEAAEGITTGISAADRSHTIKTAVDKNSKPSDIVQPGHVFPLKAMKGGVLRISVPDLQKYINFYCRKKVDKNAENRRLPPHMIASCQ